jgi:hypothetical protein
MGYRFKDRIGIFKVRFFIMDSLLLETAFSSKGRIPIQISSGFHFFYVEGERP